MTNTEFQKYYLYVSNFYYEGTLPKMFEGAYVDYPFIYMEKILESTNIKTLETVIKNINNLIY